MKKSTILIIAVISILAVLFLCAYFEEPQTSQQEKNQGQEIVQDQYQDEEFISWMANQVSTIGVYANLTVDAIVNDELYLAKSYADQGYDYCIDALSDITDFKISPDVMEFYSYGYSFLVNMKWTFFYFSLYADTHSLADLHEANEYFEDATHDLENMTLWLKCREAEKCP
ncbi:MAG: hypothetical protein DRN18_00125 [Thermoplasmata archaeon]|nr:MAG: hypothetical protein DRN18_00125 [Thermoplasmata archaeon]